MSEFFGGYPASANNVINLDYILKEIEAFKEELSTVEARALAVAKQYTDAAVAAALNDFTSRLLEFETLVNGQIDDIKRENQEFQTQIVVRLDNFEQTINLSIEDFKTYVNAKVAELEIRVNALYSYVDLQNAELETRLKAYIENQLIDLRVVNYFTGEKVTVQEMLNYLSQLHVTNGLTYRQLVTDYTGITYAMLDNYCDNENISYTDFTIELKTIMDDLEP